MDLVDVDPAGLEALAGWLADPAAPKAFHDAKGPVAALAARGLTVAGLYSDTALAAYLCRPDQRSYDLADLTLRHLGRELRVEDEAEGAEVQLSLDVDLADGAADAAESAMVRARAVLELAGSLDGELAERSATSLLHEVELPLVEVLGRMERAGIAIDVPALSDLEGYFADAVAAAAKEAFAVIGTELNLGSPKQLQTVLFEQLGHAQDRSAPRPATPRTPRRWPSCT